MDNNLMPGSNIAYPSQLGKSSGSSDDKKLTIIVGVIIILVVGSISYFLLKKPKKTESPKTINQVENEIKPTPTEKPKIDKKTLKIQVLNGTGTPGQAGKVVTALKEAEFSPENIEAANAPSYDFTQTTIATKKEYEQVADEIKTTLKSLFDSIKIETSYLEADNKYDIIITTGGKKYEEATPTPTEAKTNSETPTPTPTLTSTPTPTPTP
jgi:cell division septation protein DedD